MSTCSSPTNSRYVITFKLTKQQTLQSTNAIKSSSNEDEEDDDDDNDDRVAKRKPVVGDETGGRNEEDDDDDDDGIQFLTWILLNL